MPSQGESAPRAKHVSRAILLVAGIALGVFLVWKTGWAAVEANLASIGWWFFGLTALYLLAEIAFVLGWRAVMDPRPPLSSLPALLRIYLAGNTLNYLAPGSVAGEPVRASMLRERLGTSSAIASVAIFKHAHMLSQAFFVASGPLRRGHLLRPARGRAVDGAGERRRAVRARRPRDVGAPEGNLRADRRLPVALQASRAAARAPPGGGPPARRSDQALLRRPAPALLFGGRLVPARLVRRDCSRRTSSCACSLRAAGGRRRARSSPSRCF